MTKKKKTQIQQFVEVVRRLRKECPWDKKQTHKTLIPYLLEESHEAIEAIEKGKTESIKEELGDVLLQVVLHSVIAEQKDKFDFEDVAKAIKDKMIVRHPHVFSTAKITTAEEQTKNWSKMKSKEKKSLLSGTPRSLPALQLSQRYGEIAASVNFDWPNADEVMKKVDEELAEVKEAMQKKNKEELELEIGDLLFTITRLAAHKDIDAERALKKSAAKFENRFQTMETLVKKQGKSLSDMNLEQLDQVWNQVKKSLDKVRAGDI